MMNKSFNSELSIEECRKVDSLVAYYLENEDLALMALNSIVGYINLSTNLKPHVHTVKQRLKDSDHLRGKLIRKTIEAKNNGTHLDINNDNLFLKINDLIGIRIIHLHTRQIEYIDKNIKQILHQQHVELIEGPKARTWDHESEAYFKSIGFEIMTNENMYTSIHYVVKPSAHITCEIQVRTLMEEVWGEVDHAINYPHKSESISCREQIKVLARVTSSCSRLVDSIFNTHAFDIGREEKLKTISKKKRFNSKKL